MTGAVALAIVAPVLAIVSAVCFILGLKSMARARTAPRGSGLLVVGFVVALVEMGFEGIHLDERLALYAAAVGVALGLTVGGKSSIRLGRGVGPLLAAAGGVAAALVAVSAFASPEAWPAAGSLALTGGQRGAALGLGFLAGLIALLLGLLAAFGPSAQGAGQPATTALTAACSGLAAAMVGFAAGNAVVVTVGGLVAAAGYSLARIVGGALGRRPLDIAFAKQAAGKGDEYHDVKACGSEEAAMVLETAARVVVVPGYGMAVAQAQHAVGEVARLLAAHGARVRYAIHPAAGLIPGHMNILLDEAKVEPEQLLEGEAANAELGEADVALVVGANDIVNPAARDDRQSPLFGMPLVDVGRARAVFVIKRSLRPGMAGVKNALFEAPQVTMIFGDAKKVLQAIGVELKAQAKAAA